MKFIKTYTANSTAFCKLMQATFKAAQYLNTTQAKVEGIIPIHHLKNELISRGENIERFQRVISTLCRATNTPIRCIKQGTTVIAVEVLSNSMPEILMLPKTSKRKAVENAVPAQIQLDLGDAPKPSVVVDAQSCVSNSVSANLSAISTPASPHADMVQRIRDIVGEHAYITITFET